MAPITVKIEFSVVVEEKEGYFLASCDSLDVYAEGATHDDAKDHIGEALDVFVTTCIEMGSLERVLSDAGYKKAVHEDTVRPNLKEELVSVPFSLLAAKNNGLTQAFAH